MNAILPAQAGTVGMLGLLRAQVRGSTVLGVLGAYVARIYEQCQGRPLYVLKDASPPEASPPVRAPRQDSRAA